jgi:hypothetical protein
MKGRSPVRVAGVEPGAGRDELAKLRHIAAVRSGVRTRVLCNLGRRWRNLGGHERR